MKVIDIEWACGCCHTPPLDYAEISLADGMLSITTDHRDDIDAYTVRKYGADNRLIEEN
ncbi:MAG: hypothetical protein RL375_864, partial [Pseudomonadota bacterium]